MGPLALLLLGLVGADYSHHEDYMQGDFFEKWDFISANDPTHGFVDYVTAEKAKAENLIRTDANGIFIGVDNRSVVAPGARGRMSVRLESTARYNDGLFIISLEHAPTGCGSWPAFWMFGEDADHVWPEWGEFDIMEWIHEEEEVSTTLHTKENCTQEHLYPGWHMKGKWNKGKWNTNNAHDCYVHADGQWTNQGCSQRGLHGSVGPSFNAAGGGTYAAEWDPVAGHMRVWVWHSGQEPADVKSKMPNPMLWGQPDFYFALSDNCHPLHFKNMKLVFDITFCGDLAGPATFKQHCGKKKRGKKQRKYKDCVAFVRDEYEEFYDTYWSVQALDVYRRTDISSSPELAGVQTDLRQCRFEHSTKLQKRIQELESILFMKDAELRELYASLKAETQDMPPGHGRPVMSMDS